MTAALPPIVRELLSAFQSLQSGPLFGEVLLSGPPKSLALVDLEPKKLSPDWVLCRVRISLLGDYDVVEVAWHLLPAFFAIRSEPYTKRLFHAWHLRPAVQRVATARVSLLWRRSGVRFDIHGMITARLGGWSMLGRSGARPSSVVTYNTEGTQCACRCRELHGRRRSRGHAWVELTIKKHPWRTKLLASALTNRGWQPSILHHVPVGQSCPIQRTRHGTIRRRLSETRGLHRVACRSTPVVSPNLSSERAMDWRGHPAGDAARLQRVWLAVPWA